MAPFLFHAEFDDGRSVEVVPSNICPLGPAHIRTLEDNEASALELELEVDDAIVNGDTQVGRAKVNVAIAFQHPATVYALVQGGWLPLPFAMPARFLVDRNVVISLRKIREGKGVANAEALQWWTRFFAEGFGLFNPLPFAIEAGYQRKPTMPEFVSAFDDGVAELLEALPGCQIVKFEDINYRAAYSQLEAFDSRNEREVKFLQAACPLVAQRVSRQREAEVARVIVQTADTCQMKRASIAVLAVLSCLFEDIHGSPLAIGRRVLKPKAAYSDSDAFNALSDLRHIEVAAAGQTYFGQEAFSLCTCDKALALLWSALSLRGESPSGGAIEFTFDLTADLFSRLSEEKLRGLKLLLEA